ncbi:MAG: hypothetical protein IPG10_16955 [Flavobacteriales bacterium]|nr:hypothetical protein [Flavobacteriales bacterium]MBK6755368.1 hypothetical protein [Flavobacteriales bacterium]MBK7086152.1 hypothetical protein [Flavobacteriales bacterium]MBK7753713.1 hypothetical protein [Flavobacteriales bacterium]MBK9075202.1 hypothetical protein [Flavobacteriales bacterium]
MSIAIKQNKKKETVITLPGKFDEIMLDQAIRYMRYLYLTRNSKATQADADALAEEINESAYRKRRKRMAS